MFLCGVCLRVPKFKQNKQQIPWQEGLWNKIKKHQGQKMPEQIIETGIYIH